MHGLSIGQLAKSAKVSIHTIRYYEKAGLLPQPARRPSGFRKYSQDDLLQLKFVREARSLGFSLSEIAELLTVEARPLNSKHVSEVLEKKLAAIDHRIAELQRWRYALAEWEKSHVTSRSSIFRLLVRETDTAADSNEHTCGRN